MKVHEVLSIGLVLAFAGIASLGAVRQLEGKGRQAMFPIPNALKVDHDKLHADLSAATKLPGKTGQAAKAVAAVLHEHFVNEEEFAMPPLALLAEIAEGRVTPEMRSVIAMTDRLKREMPQMLTEHKAIVKALNELEHAATAERHPEVGRFVEELTAHAQTEEQVLYPAAIVVGEFLKLKFPPVR
jgi:hypothetical protein